MEMEFNQLVEYNLRNTFFEKSCPNYNGETISRLFFKKSKLSLDQYSKVLYILFLLFGSLRSIKID